VLIDAHSHLDRYALAEPGALHSALAEIARLPVFTLSNSMDPDAYRRNLEISEACEWVLPAFGVHPWNAPRFAGRLQELRSGVEQSPVIGEIGLDHHFVEDPSAYPAQREVFEFFLSEARDQKKIVTVHTKGAEREVLELLARYALPRVIVHWYSGPLGVFKKLAATGVYFTVGFEVARSDHIRKVARAVPTDRLLSETDNPGGASAFLGAPGRPALILQVVRGIAQARKSSARAIEEAVQANLLELFGDDPRLATARDRVSKELADSVSRPAD
jgi:TatD DNase family protein